MGTNIFVPSSQVEMYGQSMSGGKQFVHCREVKCPLSEVLLYMYSHVHSVCSAASQKHSLVPRPSVETVYV